MNGIISNNTLFPIAGLFGLNSSAGTSFNDFFTAKYVDNIIHPIAIKDPSNALVKSKLLIKSPRVYIILYIPYIILGIVFDPIITPNTEPIVVASSA